MIIDIITHKSRAIALAGVREKQSQWNMLMVTPTDKREETLRQQQVLLDTLKRIAPIAQDNKLPPQETWPSTRQLVKSHDISIYRARYLLLDMVKKNMILVSDRNFSHTLRWFPT